MKLNSLQRLAIKLGVPRSVLNGFAQEYYGYAIPDADGKYPDWWYKEQNIPPTVRDCEVPKEVLKHEKGSKYGPSAAPKTYVRVRHGKIVEIVGNEAATQSVPHFPSHRRDPVGQYPQTSYPRRRHEVLHTDAQGDFPVETDEIIYRVTDTRRFDGPPRLSRTISTPVFPVSMTDQDDIMSLIREDGLPRTRQPTVVGDVLDTPSAVYNAPFPGTAFPNPHRSSTVPNPRPNAYSPQQSSQSRQTPRRGPSLPTSPRPTVHRRTETTATDNTIFGYYSSPAANSPASAQTSYPQGGRRRSYRPLEEVEEDEMSEWSGYASETGDGWEDAEEEPFGRTQAFRQAAAENLRNYRQGR